MTGSEEQLGRLFLGNRGSAFSAPLGSRALTTVPPRNSNDDIESIRGNVVIKRSNIRSPSMRTFSNTSTSSSQSQNSDNWSHNTVASTASSSAPSLGSVTPPMYHYPPGVLPCEFSVLGCQIWFNQTDTELWISHCTTHFGNTIPPRKVVCTFCDETFRAPSEAQQLSTWRERLVHIASHYQNLESYEKTRPDYFLLDHLRKYKLLSEDDYNNATEYSERPEVDGLVKYGHETMDMKLKKERAARELHDLQKERRQIRKEKKNNNNKGKEPHRLSSKNRQDN